MGTNDMDGSVLVGATATTRPETFQAIDPAADAALAHEVFGAA